MIFHNILKPDQFFYLRSLVGFCLDTVKIAFKSIGFMRPPPSGLNIAQVPILGAFSLVTKMLIFRSEQ